LSNSDYDSLIREINDLLMEDELESGRLISSLNTVFAKIQPPDQMRVHNDVSKQSLICLYRILDQLNIAKEVKEHLMYGYYLQIVNDEKLFTQNVFNELVDDYNKTKFVALESVVINLIKWDALSNEQVKIVDKVFGEKKAVKKQLVGHTARSILRQGIPLDMNIVKELLEWNNFDLLEQTLEKKLIAYDALHLFKKPSEGEENKKKKERLFLKAKFLLANK